MADSEKKIREKYKKYLEKKKEWKQSDLYKEIKEKQKKDPLRRFGSPMAKGIGSLISKDKRELMKESFRKKEERLDKIDKGKVGKILHRLAPKTTRLLAGKKATRAIEERITRDKQAKIEAKERERLEKEKEKVEKLNKKIHKREVRRAKFQQRKEKIKKKWKEYEEKHPKRAFIIKTVGESIRDAPGKTKLGVLEPLRLVRRRKKEKESTETKEVFKKPEKVKCPYCGEIISSERMNCPYCGELVKKTLTKEQREELEKFAEDEVKRQMNELKGK